MIRNCAIWPTRCLEMFSLLSKELTFILLFAITAAGVVPCGGLKKSPRSSSIVQIIFYFRSFEVNGNILMIQTLVVCLEPFILDSILFLIPL